MSDQNLEYSLDVDIVAAERKLKALFGDMESSMGNLGKAVGKNLKNALTEQEQSAREFGRQLTALDRAVQSNFTLVEKLSAKYVGLGNTKLDGLIGQLDRLTKTSISPELQKLMDNRAATPAGMLKSETGSIREQIDAEIAAINNRKAMEKQEAEDFIQLQKMKSQAASQRLKEEMDAEKLAAKNRKSQDELLAAQFVEEQRIKRETAQRGLRDAEAAESQRLKAALDAQAQEKQLLEQMEKDDIRRMQAKRARQEADDAAKKKSAADSLASERAMLDEWERRDSAAAKQRRSRLKDEDSEENKALQQRIGDAQKLAVETGKATAEKFGHDQVYRNRVGEIYADLNAKYDTLMKESVGMTSEAVSARIQLIEKEATTAKAIAANAAQDRAMATAKTNASLGRFSSNLYMAQQAVEDFSYAGLRGATNNLAFIASTIAGPAGTAAMVGMLGLQFAYSTGMLEKFDKELGVSEKLMALFGMRSKEQIELNKKEAESHLALYQARMETREALAKFSITDFDKPQNEKAQRDKAIDIELMQKQVAQLERLKATYDAYVAAKAKGNTLDNLRNPTSLDEIRNAFKGGDADKLLRDAVNQGNALGIAINPEEMQKVSGELDSVRDSLRKLIEEADRLQQLENKFKSFGASFDKYKQGWKDIEFSNEQKDTTGMTSKGADVFRDYLERQGQSVEEYRKTLDQWVESHQDVPGVLDKANEALQQSTENWDKQAAALQENLKHQGDVVTAIEKEINAYERYISKLERAIEKESEHRDSLAMERSAFEDNATKRQSSALDKIDDLKLDEENKALKEQFDQKMKMGKAQKDWFLQDAENRAEWAKRLVGKGSINGIGAKDIDQWLENQRDWANRKERNDTDGLSNKLKQQMDANEKAAQESKQKRLDDLKNQLGDKADKLTGEAQKAMEGGNLEKASDSLKKAMKTMEELQQAQEKTIGQVSSKQAEQIEKDLKGSSDKMLKLFDMMEEVSQKNTEKLQGDHTRALEFMKELEWRKTQAEAIDPYAPTAFQQLDEIMLRIKAIGDEKMRVASIPFQMGGMGGMMAGGPGGGFGGGSSISNVTVNMASSATPSAAMAAAKAAAASIVMQRA